MRYCNVVISGASEAGNTTSMALWGMADQMTAIYHQITLLNPLQGQQRRAGSFGRKNIKAAVHVPSKQWRKVHKYNFYYYIYTGSCCVVPKPLWMTNHHWIVTCKNWDCQMNFVLLELWKLSSYSMRFLISCVWFIDVLCPIARSRVVLYDLLSSI